MAVKIVSDDNVFRGHQIANLLYSDVFVQNRRDVGMRFMRAYLRAVRFYNDALSHGKLAGPNAVVDNSFVEAALKSLGRYRPKAGAGN